MTDSELRAKLIQLHNEMEKLVRQYRRFNWVRWASIGMLWVVIAVNVAGIVRHSCP